MLTGRGVFRGIPGVRELARQLMAEIPSGRWTNVNQLVEGRMGFLEWTVDEGQDPDGRVLIRADGTRTS